MPKKYSIILLPTLITVAVVTFIFVFYRKEIFILQNSKGYDNSKRTALFHGAKVDVPAQLSQQALSYNDILSDVADIKNSDSTSSDVLGSRSKEKRIEVDLSEQKLYAFEGSKKVMNFDVSTGKWGKTPTGDFRIWIKLKYTLMTGGSKELGTYYYLPNVPYAMFFYKDFGIHGTYWHDNFGHPMSHGCINMKTSEAEKLFYWASPSLPENSNSVLASDDKKGTQVIIYETAPDN